MNPGGGLRAASRPALIPRTMARTTLMEADDERLLPHPVEDVYGVLADVGTYPRWWPQDLGVAVRRSAAGLVGSELAIEPSGGRPFRLRVVDARRPTRIALAYEASWLEGEGEWTLRRRRTGALVRYRVHVRSDRWLAVLAGKALDLPAMHTRQMRDVLGALEAEAALRRSGGRR